MFSLIKGAIALVVVAAVAYFSYFVPLGELTLWEHMVGISHTSEAQALGDALGAEAEAAAKEVSRRVAEAARSRDGRGQGDRADGGAPISADDRRAIEQLIRHRVQPDEQDRDALDKMIKARSD